VVVALASAGLGNWVGFYVQRGITEGVAATAAASIDSLVAHEVGALGLHEALSEAEKATLDQVFAIGNDADSTRLLQIRIRNTEGRLVYESAGALSDPEQGEELHFRQAAAGAVSSRLAQVAVPPVGTIAGLPIDVLEIFTPLHNEVTGEIFAIAELYYSAKSVLDQRDRAQVDVWILVGLSGLVVIGALYLLVDRASVTIARQRDRLASNLAASRRLSDENRALRDASEELRQNANSANEALLAQVGSDIHDGPVQMLTLIILRLSKAAVLSPEMAATATLATEAIEELRNISNGLVLPELASLTLADALLLAISRHEQLTGVHVRRTVAALPETALLVVKICAYRVIQEALTNAFRHGAAEGQAVSAKVVGDRLVVRITNKARKGEKHEGTQPGLGLRGMRFRVESLGGALRADIGVGSANVVEAEIPLGQPG
jgi:hypothetical protein